MGGTYESFSLAEIVEKSKQEGYMLDLAAKVRAKVNVPVIAAGRLATGALADQAISEGKTDLIGLARVLWADPQWPKKVYYVMGGMPTLFTATQTAAMPACRWS